MLLHTELKKIFPFWLFVFFFKVSASLHYTLLSTLGERVLPIWIVGFLVGGGALIQVILDIPAGYLLDRYGYVRLLKGATLIFIAAAACLLLGLTSWTYIVTILLSTIGWLFFGPGVNAYVLSRAKKAIAGRFIATRDVIESASVVLAMAALPFVISRSSWLMGAALMVPLMIAFVAILFAPRDAHSIRAEKKVAAQGFYLRRSFFQRLFEALGKLNPASTILFFSGFSGSLFYGVIWFVVPLMMVRSVEAGSFGIGLAIFDLAILLVGFIAGELTDHWDKRWLIFWGLLLFSVCALLLGFHAGILFLVFGFLATTGDELSSVSLWAWIDHLDKDHLDDALVSGAMSFSEDLGWTIGPMIAGLLFELIGPSWTIAAGAIFIFANWLTACVYLKKAPSPDGPLKLRAQFPRKKRHKR